MEQQETRLPLEWLSSRRTPELHRLEQLCRETAREQRCTQRRLQEVEEAMASDAEKRPGAVSGASGMRAQLEQLSRKLNAANAELRRYETRMFAYERTMLALRKENAELTTQCEELRRELDAVLNAPHRAEKAVQELPVIDFPPLASEQPAAGKAPAPAEKKRPRTRLEHLSDEVLAQLAQLMPQQDQN